MGKVHIKMMNGLNMELENVGEIIVPLSKREMHISPAGTVHWTKKGIEDFITG